MGRPTQQLTMRRVALRFEGDDLPIIPHDNQVVARQILNLTELCLTIVNLLGPEVEYCYCVVFIAAECGIGGLPQRQ